MAARGSLDRILTYQMHGTRARVYPHTIPNDPRDQDVLNTRAHFLDAARLWSFLTDADKTTWNQAHIETPRTGYNLFQRTIQKRETVTANWKDPRYASQGEAVPNVLCYIPMELQEDSSFLDISGNAREWAPSLTTQEQGDRGQCAEVGASTDNSLITYTSNLGTLTTLSVALRFYSDDEPADIPGGRGLLGNCYRVSGNGFILAHLKPGLMFRVRNGAIIQTAQTTQGYIPGRWNDIVALHYTTMGFSYQELYLNDDLVASASGLGSIPNTSTAVHVLQEASGQRTPARVDNVLIYLGHTEATRI